MAQSHKMTKWQARLLQTSVTMATDIEICSSWQIHAIRYLIYPIGSKIPSVSLYGEPFPRYRFVYFRRLLPWQRSRKLRRVDKNMLNGSKHTPQGPNLYPFRSTMSRFRDTGPFTLDVRYHGNGHGNWDELTKTCYMVVNIPHRVQIFIRFALRWAVSEIQVRLL